MSLPFDWPLSIRSIKTTVPVEALPPTGRAPLITAPARDGTSLAPQSLYWRLRAACYYRVPGVVDFYDTNSVPRFVQDQGLTVVESSAQPGRVTVLARA
jgi:hypothetical protein